MDKDELQKRGVSTHAGFPNAATEAHSKLLDLNHVLIPHPAATFMMELDDNAWEKQGMFSGDIVIVDRAIDPRKNDLVIWWEGEDFTFGHLKDAPSESPVWGVVRSVIHQLKK